MRSGYRDDRETGAFAGERLFRSGGIEVRYLLELPAGRPDALVVAFSAAHEEHEAPRYYTVRALRAVPYARLFVLDDQGPRGTLARPSWYLGRNRSPDLADAVVRLMRAVAEELRIARGRLVTCGASKGGWAALYFGARSGAAHAIAGEPQAFLGRHLLQDGTYDIAAHVAGGTSPRDGEFLDAVLFEALRAAASPPRVHLYCGANSFYYQHHVLPLCRFLDEREIPYELELGNEGNHVPDLGVHFPPYLVARLKTLLDGTRVS